MSDGPRIEFPEGERIAPIRGIVNRDQGGYFLTRAPDAWMRLARYLELYETRGLDQLLAELDANTDDAAIHPNAVLLMAVRLAASLGALTHQRSSRMALAFAGAPGERQDIARPESRLWLPN